MTGGGGAAWLPLGPGAGTALVLISRSAVVALLACVAPWAPRADAKPPAWATVTLVMSEYRFAPAQLHFRQGVRYRLVMENRGKELHEFTAPIFLGQIAIANPGILAPGSKDIVVRVHEHKELRFVAAKRGHYRFTCADHDWAGMIGEIVVE
jgi:uncharacterized cupredoxin-like copper-binding protein